jgi:hypothetical protein
MSSKDRDLGEQAISKAAEVGIDSQLDEVDKLDVDVEANPLDVAQGKVKSVTIDAEGMVMNKDLRTERLVLQTGSIDIDALKAAFGNIELEHSTDAEAKIVLKEEDLQRAFNSEYIQNKLKNQKVDIDGETVTVNAENVKFTLPGDEKISLSAEIDIAESSETKKIAVSAKPRVEENGNKIVLEDVEYPNGENTNPELTQALLDSTSELLDLRNFELDEMSLQIKRLDVRQGKMTMTAHAEIREFPDS